MKVGNVSLNQALCTTQQADAESVSAESLFRRFGFHFLVGAFILITSFAYGISAGLKKNREQNAFAALQGGTLLRSSTLSGLPSGLDLPSGLIPVPLGEDIMIGTSKTKLVSFISDRSPDSIVIELAKKWELTGAKVLKAGTPRRGFVLGFDQTSGNRSWLIAWTVPPSIRQVASQGRRVQGFLSVIEGKSTPNADLHAGQVPGVPVIPGGRGGAVFSSMDVGGRSHTGVYTNPGSVEDGMRFYRNELAVDGWREVSGGEELSERLGFGIGSVTFQRGSEEILLLFTPVSVPLPDAASADAVDLEKTGVLVTRGPRQVSGGRLLYEQ